METVLFFKQSLFLLLRSKMLSAVFYLAQIADQFRASLLRQTMKVPLFRTLFVHRPYRLAVFFAISIITNFIIAIFFPLYGLLLGPIVFGIPHMFASLRYLPKITMAQQTPQSVFNVVGFLFVVAATVRIALSKYHTDLQYLPNGPELFMACVGMLALALLTRQKTANWLFTILLVSGLSFCSYIYPYQTIGALVLVHNFISFVFWIKSGATSRDKTVAVLSLIVFSVMTLLILTGGFDDLMNYRPTGILNNALNELSIGSMIAPNSSIAFWNRAVSAYAFGQGVHYFVWLKAIPEQELKDGPTISFSKSFQLLQGDLGRKLVVVCILLTLFILGLCILKNFPTARYVYLLLASFHGYFELTCLFLDKTESVA